MSAPATYIFGPFRLVAQRRELLMHGIPVTLGQRAIEVLLTLVSRAGQLVTKDEIMSEVWPGVIVEENNLQVHISALRKALGSAGDAKSFLLTVAGRGYRFIAPVEVEGPIAAAARAPVIAEQAPARTTNLPKQLTSFIGRQREREQIAEQLQRSRLVTLTGPGGVGKTRLAIELGWELTTGYPDGVWLVELAPLQDAQLVLTTILDVVGIEKAGVATLPFAAAALDDKHLLLILDNCEHVIGEAAAVAEALLRAAPCLSILATSRERLAIDGETVLRVPPLKLPEGATNLTAAEAGAFEAVALFAERARALGEDWSFTDTTANAVVSLCRRLDGLPLAIEMAVPRLRMLSLAQLQDSLNERFQVLSAGRRTAQPRHRTLQAVIEWSYALLSDEEKVLLQQVSVFAGNAGLDAITAITGGAEHPGSRISDLLLSLIEKSLVVAERAQDGIRYRLLESNRDFAWQMLGPDAALLLQRRHADYYRARLAQATAEWETTPGERWLDRYGADIDELRAALLWAFGPQGDAGLGFDLVGNSHVMWGELGLTDEHRRWVQEALKRTDDATPKSAVARLLSWHAGDVKEIDDPSDYDDAVRAAGLHAELGDAFAEGQTLLRAGCTHLISGGDEGREELLRKAQKLLEPFGVTKSMARCFSALASARLLAGDLPQARELHEKALSISRQIDGAALREADQ